jgi:hypothetical protein
MKCKSAHRCALTSCESCCWKLSRRIAQQIFTTNPRELHIVTFDIKLSIGEFVRWRGRVRNAFEHRRRASSYFKGTGVWLWLQNDGSVRGIVSLGAVTADEFVAAFGRRWPITLKPIDVAAVRDQVYYITRPGIIAEVHGGRGGYQRSAKTSGSIGESSTTVARAYVARPAARLTVNGIQGNSTPTDLQSEKTGWRPLDPGKSAQDRAGSEPHADMKRRVIVAEPEGPPVLDAV